MNERKIAIFVEGQAELIFVREFLYRWYCYDTQEVGIECLSLRARQFNPVPYPVGNRYSRSFFQVVNVGNDQSVLGKMIKEVSRLRSVGFQKVVGLRDMFCDEYHKAALDRCVHEEINQRFISGHQQIIDKHPEKESLFIHFAIMELEAWLLAMPACIRQISSSLTYEEIQSNIHVDLSQDPEMEVYHPASVLKKICGLENLSYGKHERELERLISPLQREDFEDLIRSGKCSSFANFVNRIIC